MPPKPADGKNNSKKKAEELQLLLDRVEKMINKANANIDLSKSERNLLMMQDSLTTLETAQELLNNNPIKLPAKEKKKKIQPLQSSIDLIKHDFTQAVEEEQKLRRVEAVQEWTCVEVGQILNERSIVKSILLRIKDKLQEEYKKRDEELDWQLWVSCNHLPDPRSEVALNDFINDWEKDKVREKSLGRPVTLTLSCALQGNQRVRGASRGDRLILRSDPAVLAASRHGEVASLSSVKGENAGCAGGSDEEHAERVATLQAHAPRDARRR